MLCIGVGNVYRHDDGVGLYVAQLVRDCAVPGLEVCDSTGDGAELVELFSEAEAVILVDAVTSGGKPGTLYEIDVLKQAVPASMFAFSTHAFGVAEAVEMARVLGKLPERLVIYGIEGAHFDMGCGLTPAVEQTAHEVVRLIAAEGVQLDVRGGTH